MGVLSSRICAVHITRLFYPTSYVKVSMDSNILKTTLCSLGLNGFQGMADGGVVIEGSCA